MIGFEEIVTFEVFSKEIKKFLLELLNKPNNPNFNTFWTDKGFSRDKFIQFLLKRDIIEKEEKISEVNTINFKYKVPKKDFDRKLKKLYIFLFEENVPKKYPKIETDTEIDESTGCGGVTGGENTIVQPLFGIQKKDLYSTKNENKNHIQDMIKDELKATYPLLFDEEEDEEEMVESTTTMSVGDYTYDAPPFIDKESADRKNIFANSFKGYKK